MKRIPELLVLSLGVGLIIAAGAFRYPITFTVRNLHINLFELEVITGLLLLVAGTASLFRRRA